MTPFQILVAQVASFSVVQVLVGWWLKARLEQSVKHEYDRRLEQFKAHETLAVEIAKQRVAALAEAWRHLALFEAQCWKQSRDVAVRILELARDHGGSWIPASLPTGHKDLFELLGNASAVSIPSERIEAMQRDAAAEQTRLLGLADELDAYLASNRFWIGSDIDRELREYAQTVRDAFAALGGSVEERRDFARLLRLARDKRWDARGLVKRLQDSENE